MAATLPSLDEIRRDFDDLEDGSERLEYLIELGRMLPDFPATARCEGNRVQGCQSNVWLLPHTVGVRPARLEFAADSDAPMVKGLVAILVASYSGRTAAEILDFAPQALFEQLKLRSFLTPMRSNGLHSMVLHVLALAQHVRDAEAPAADPAGAVAPTIAASAAAPAVASAPSVTPMSAAEVAALRADFPILATTLDDGRPLVYLDNAASTQRPRQVIGAMVEAYEKYYSNVHRGGHALAARTTERYEGARRSLQRLLGARHAHEIVFTSGTTAAINLVARGWGDANVRAGDEILLTQLEHHSNLIPWQQLAARTGARLRFIPVTDEGRLDLSTLSTLVGERTRLIAATAVSNVTGTINDVRPLVHAARGCGAKILIDAAQAVPHQSVDVVAWDVDFLAFSGHKLLGPSGVGVLYGKEALLDAMPPFLGGGSMIRSATLEGFVPAALPAKFEAGTPPIVPAIGLGAAVEYLERIGLERIHLYEQQLTARAHAGLVGVSGLRILGPAPTDKAGLVTFHVEGVHADDVAKVLDARGIAVRAGHHCAMPLHERFGLAASCRASFYLYNTLEEVDALTTGIVAAVDMIRRATKS